LTNRKKDYKLDSAQLTTFAQIFKNDLRLCEGGTMPRPSQPKDVHLLVKISHMYHEQGNSEDQIARSLHLSRSKVSRLLKQARQLGIVKISVIPPPGFFPKLEEDLERKYSLKEALVVDVADPDSPNSVAKELGVVAARHLQQTLNEGEIIGISWGTTLNAMIAALQYQKPMSNHVVQIIGGLGEPTSEIHATDLCRRMASALNSDLTLLPSPGIVSSRQVRDALLGDRFIQNALRLYSKLGVAYVGIGAPTPDSVVIRDGAIMSQAELDRLLVLGAVGDIALRYYDRNGQPICGELDERVIGITLEELKNIDRVVGVAGGVEKLQAIRGALLGKNVNVLITDQHTAMELLRP
jgi:DNA-binding transcriptional regulator LsrR (DeoR family)